MKIEIKHRFNGSVLFSIEAKSLKIALEIAVRKKADLREAYLTGAYLRGADLTRATLTGAYLRGADLREAYLTGAYLRGADLTRANLTRADLTGAYLRGADLTRANLTGAYLTGAYLTRADLTGAYLTGVKGVSKYLCTPLEILREQVGKIRAYKLVNSELFGVYYPKIKYVVGKTLEVKKADENEQKQCSKGISLATLDWCMKEWQAGRKILVCEFTKNDIAAIPIATDGKFRVRKCKVIKEVDLEKIGLVSKPPKANEK